MSNFGFTVPTSDHDDEDRLVGDWNRFTENATTHSRTHGGAHKILTAASQTVAHNVKGNQTGLPCTLTTSTSGLTLDGDFENKLRAADTNNDGIDNVLYKWDAPGRRIGRDNRTDDVVYFQNGQQTLADYPAGTAASSPTYTYVYGSYIDETVLRTDSSSNKLYYHRNGQYSITALTDAAGTIAERYAYDAYGKLTVLDGGTVLSGSSHGNRYTYTGREWDEELGLYYFRARMYSASTGRFVSRDPIGYEGSSWNVYEFIFSGPLSETDQSGKTPLHVGVGAAVIALSSVYACVGPQYLMAQSTHGGKSDKFRHCWVSCRTAKTCGLAMSFWAGLAKEVRDRAAAQFCRQFPGSWICSQGSGAGDFWDSLNDMKANQACMHYPEQ